MKAFLRDSVVYTLSLYLISLVFDGLGIEGGAQTLIIAGVIFTLISYIIKPILKIITLPLTLITFGVFSFFINAILLYLLVIMVPQITVTAFAFQGMSIGGFVSPPIYFNVFFAYIVISFAISFIATAIKWVFHK